MQDYGIFEDTKDMRDKEKHIFHRDVQDALELIGGRWRGAIMASLCGSPKRFSDLKADLNPVTSRVLIRELRYLEHNRLIVVERSSLAANSVLYSHSEHGSSCAPIIIQLRDWAVKHRIIMLDVIKENSNSKT
ncbi:DNA-binding HxlR family transcriptional regulator [Mucilaginibacter sp. UYP25]